MYYLKKIDSKIESVLELGSSNGFRLNTLKKLFPTIDVAVGVDPSKLAVQDGKERYGLEMYENNIVDFEFDDYQFDLVIVNFVYYWVDRKNILKAVANTDSFVKDKGYLVIGDFLPNFPQRVNYHHTDEEVYTYKLNYPRIFESTNNYKKIFETTFNADEKFSGNVGFVESQSRGNLTS